MLGGVEGGLASWSSFGPGDSVQGGTFLLQTNSEELGGGGTRLLPPPPSCHWSSSGYNELTLREHIPLFAFINSEMHTVSF